MIEMLMRAAEKLGKEEREAVADAFEAIAIDCVDVGDPEWTGTRWASRAEIPPRERERYEKCVLAAEIMRGGYE